MGAQTWAVLAAVLVAVVLLALLLVGRDRSRRRLAAAYAETAELRRRLDELTERLDDTSAALAETREAYLITDAGLEHAGPQEHVPDRLVLSAAFGEPLVRTVAFVHGVARALSPESRNRIRFEMRREVRRARKERRRDVKDAVRRARAERRTGDDARTADAA